MNQRKASPLQDQLEQCYNCRTNNSTNMLWSLWNNKIHTIKGTNFTLCGFSIAAFRTNFFIKELNVMFDGGVSSNFSPTHLFITHLHSDHVANIPYHFISNKNKLEIYIPPNTTKRMRPFIESTFMYEGENIELGEKSQISDSYKLIEAYSDTITIKKKEYFLEIINSDHTVPCISYGLSEKRTRLKEQYKSLSSKEIKDLKIKGEQITEEYLFPFFVYVGDTSREILLNNELKKYSTIMIECTFLNDDEEERANSTKHMHWNHLKPFIEENPNIEFILYHFSFRYKKHYIDEFFKNIDLPNIVIWNSN